MKDWLFNQGAQGKGNSNYENSLTISLSVGNMHLSNRFTVVFLQVPNLEIITPNDTSSYSR